MKQEELLDLQRSIEAVLFAAGEPVTISRLAIALQCDPDDVVQAAEALQDQLAFDRRGIRLVRLEDSFQMCSAREQADVITAALETRKPPKLSASALETLTVIAYYQPTTKAFIEQIRGVDSSYTLGVLLNKNLITECGRLNVPGRPIQYKTTPDFLRTFGLESLEDLPEIERVEVQNVTQLEIRDLQGQETMPADSAEATP
jgi:segregation and condensation protein B